MNAQGGRVVAIDLWRITVVCLLVGPNELLPEHSSSRHSVGPRSRAPGNL